MNALAPRSRAKLATGSRRCRIGGGCVLLTALLTGALLHVARMARAQGAPETPPASAASQTTVETIEQAMDDLDHGRFADAAARLETVLQRTSDQTRAKVLYNLALVYDKAGDATRTVERLESFVGQVAALPGAIPPEFERRRQDAVEWIRSIQSSHGALRFRLPPPGSSVLVRVDDATPRPAGFTAYVLAGRHRVEVAVGTPHARLREVDVAMGQTIDVDIDPLLPPAPPTARTTTTTASVHPPPLPPPPPESASSFPTTWVLIGAGATVATAALPVALGLWADSERDAAAELGEGHTDYAQAREDFETARTWYHVSYAVPAVLGAATLGITIAALAGASFDSGDERQVAVLPTVSPAGAGCQVVGSF